jgi:hypothetical protein
MNTAFAGRKHVSIFAHWYGSHRTVVLSMLDPR